MEKLPEKWYVVRNSKNYKTLNKWNNDTYCNGSEDAHRDDKAYMYSNQKYKTDSLYSEYTEITFETFMKYIINKEPQTTEYLIHN